jgi:hypothetical protein
MAEGEDGTPLEQIGYRSQYYREITPDYIFGGVRPGYIGMTVVTTKLNATEAVINKKNVLEHTEEVTLKIPPQQAKSMIIWLLQNIKSYENGFGKIKNGEGADTSKAEIGKKVDDLLDSL